MSSIATAAAEVSSLRTNLTKALQIVKDWSDNDDTTTVTTFPYACGPAGLFAALLCICDNISDPPDSGSRTYPIFKDERLVDEDFIKGCLSLCKKQAHFHQWFTPTGMQTGGSPGGNFTMSLIILTEWETSTPLSMEENVCIRLVLVIYAAIMTKQDLLVPHFRSLGGGPVVLSLLTQPTASVYAKMQFSDMIMNLRHRSEFFKGFGDALVGTLTSFAQGSSKELRSFALVVLTSITQATKDKNIRRGTKMADFMSLLATLSSPTMSMDDKREVITSMEELMKAEEAYKDVMAERAEVLVGLIEGILGVGLVEGNSTGSWNGKIEQAVKDIVHAEEAAKRRRSHDPKCWLLYTTFIILSTAAGGSEDRQQIVGRHTALLPTLLRVLSAAHDNPMVSETCAITIYKIIARSPPNRLQLIDLLRPTASASASASTLASASASAMSLSPLDSLAILIDFFDVDFSRTTQPGAKANRGFNGQRYVGWTHILACFSVLHSIPKFPVTDLALLERLHGVFAKVLSFWDSPLSKLLTFEGYSAMVSFTNSICLLHLESDLKTRLEWLLRCACGTLSKPLHGSSGNSGGSGGHNGVPLLTLYTDHLSRQMDHISLSNPQLQRVDGLIGCLLDGLRYELQNPAINGVRLGGECRQQLEWMRLKLSAGTTLASLVRSLQAARGGGEAFTSPSSSSPAVGDIHTGRRTSSGGSLRGGKAIKPTEGVCAHPTCCNQDSLKLCGRCKGVAYCGSSCQKNHWAVHKLSCGK